MRSMLLWVFHKKHAHGSLILHWRNSMHLTQLINLLHCMIFRCKLENWYCLKAARMPKAAIMLFLKKFYSESILPSADNNTATGAVVGNFAKMIFKMTMSGIHKNMPGIPQMVPQKARDSKMTMGLKLSRVPIHLGSRILPTAN